MLKFLGIFSVFFVLSGCHDMFYDDMPSHPYAGPTQGYPHSNQRVESQSTGVPSSPYIGRHSRQVVR